MLRSERLRVDGGKPHAPTTTSIVQHAAMQHVMLHAACSIHRQTCPVPNEARRTRPAMTDAPVSAALRDSVVPR